MSGLFISATGILNAIRRQDITANNVANLVTPGFQSSRVDSLELSGGGVGFASVLRNTTPAASHYTGLPMDVSTARGFFQVTLPDGASAFTLDGSFGLNAKGEIVTSNGARVEPPIQLPEGAGNVTVGRDGTVFASDRNGSAPEAVGQLRVFQFPNAEGLESIGGNLFRATSASGQAVPVQAPRVQAGTLAGSNVDLAVEAVNMIANRNAFQANVNMLKAQSDLLGELLDLRQ